MENIAHCAFLQRHGARCASQACVYLQHNGATHADIHGPFAFVAACSKHTRTSDGQPRISPKDKNAVQLCTRPIHTIVCFCWRSNDNGNACKEQPHAEPQAPPCARPLAFAIKAHRKLNDENKRCTTMTTKRQSCPHSSSTCSFSFQLGRCGHHCLHLRLLLSRLRDSSLSFLHACFYSALRLSFRLRL